MVTRVSSEPNSARLLIVDDEVSQMKALCDTLRDRGYETVGFTSASDAVTALQTRKFDLLLSDLTMPGMDGIALLQTASEADPDLVGIIMTGNGTIDTAVEAMKTGALDYILKPFKLSFILPVLERALSIRRLRMYNAELEREIATRTADLEAANKELEAFSFSVSHDLRAPLRSMNAFSEILLKRFAAEMPAEACRLLKNIAGSGRHMGLLIDNLLEFSRLGRQPISSRVVNIHSLVNELLEDLNKLHEGRKIEIHIGELPDCVGDPLLLRQAFVNLLSNAFKFTSQQEKAVIDIGTCQQEGQTAYYIKDNGAGFDMQYAEKLFGVFQRLHSSRQFEGTGVGLSIVQRIIQRHSGYIRAEAEVDKGAAFYFTLPLAAATVRKM